MTKEQAVARVAAGIRQHKVTPDAVKLKELLEELAKQVGVSVDVLSREAQKHVQEVDAKKSSNFGELEFSVGAASVRKVSKVVTEPFEDQAVFVADDKGDIPGGFKSGSKYLVVGVPDEVRVTVQPAATIAGGAQRRVMSVELIYEVVAESERSAGKKPRKRGGPQVDTSLKR